jgi:lipopolysaccharide export system protein LptC
MFTELIKKGRWSYMLLAVIAVMAVAVLTTLANTRDQVDPGHTASQEQGKAVNGSYTRYNGTTLRFVN